MMDITPYQIVVPLLSALMVVYAWSFVLRQKKTLWEASLWTLFWLAIAFVSLFPENLRYLSDLTGIKRNENAAVFTAIVVLFFILFYLVLRIEELEQRIVKIAREKALSGIDAASAKEVKK